MSTAVKELLTSFESLPENQKQEAAAVILRRVLSAEPDQMPDEALISAADELFVTLDEQEAKDARP